MADWRHWQDWRRYCSLAACDIEAREALCEFAAMRWRRYAIIYSGITNPRVVVALTPTADMAWHAFETMLRLRHTRRGKSYKQWLFARIARNGGAGEALDTVQSGASLLMRDVVRDHFRREMPRAGTLSLEEPSHGVSGQALSLGELLPSADDVCELAQQRDIERLGGLTAESLLDGMLPRRCKIAMLARETGWSLAHPMILKVAGCRKSVLNSAYHDGLHWIAEAVNNRFAKDDRSTRAALAVATLRAVKTKLIEWAKLESSLSGFFRKECTP